jgi:hypothetical protein
MSRTQIAGSKPSTMSRALARDRLGVPAVLFFVLAGVAPLTVAAGGHPDRLPDDRVNRHPGRFSRHRGDPCRVRCRLRRDDEAHHQQRGVLQSAYVPANLCEVAAEVPRVRHVVV